MAILDVGTGLLILGQAASGGGGGGSSQTTVTDSNSTAAVIGSLAANTRYVYTKALTSLKVSAVVDSSMESEIQFTAGASINVDLPASLGMIGDDDDTDGEPVFEAGKSYIINVKNNIAVAAEYTPGVTA
jgi:hypothetical protein